MYLAIILVSAACMLFCDYRWRVLLFHPAMTTSNRFLVSIAVLVQVLFFLVWDIAGIYSGIFFRGDSPYLLGLDLFYDIPVEELFFLTFLSYLGLFFAGLFRRVLP